MAAGLAVIAALLWLGVGSTTRARSAYCAGLTRRTPSLVSTPVKS